MKRVCAVLLLGFVAPLGGNCAFAAQRDQPSWMMPLSELDLDQRIPQLKDVLRHNWGQDISSHAEIEKYLKALAAAAPERTRLELYGKSYEGRGLYYLVISSVENIRRLDAIRDTNLRLSDPRRTPADEADELIAEAPAVVWLAYCIHGNEVSPSDAALLTAYHLLADTGKKTARWLDELVVVIDPLQNPDGRDRFVNVYRETRGLFPQTNPLANEHVERWPGGRSNHYLFDMNRDWFLHSQIESAARAAAYQQWHPQVYVDSHEMGRNSTYFFPPPREPINELILVRQREWLNRLGRHQAGWFDRYGFRYTTREMFDEFFPGYGSSWPLYHGSLGILWEQAGSRGLVVERDDETKLHYHEGVRHNYVSGLATLEIAAEHRRKLLQDFYDARRRAVQLGEEGPVRDFYLTEQPRPFRAARLARLLRDNGIEVERLTAAATIECVDHRNAESKERTLPAGSYRVSVAQPAGRLARVLLDRHADMGEEFVKRQLSRQRNRQQHEIYDITAWSLPLIFDVECLASAKPAEIQTANWNGELAPPPPVVKPKVAYLISGDDDNTTLALAWWLRKGLRVHVADRPLTIGGHDFPRGTLILHVHENGSSLHELVVEAAGRFGLPVVATDTAFVTRGAHLGGPFVHWVKPPRAVLLTDRPTRYSVGHTWHLFDQYLKYPLTRVPGRFFWDFDLSPFNVLILPDGAYTDPGAPSESTAQRIRQWVRAGGTLILVEGAARWATEKKVALLDTKVIRKPVEILDGGDKDTADDDDDKGDKDKAGKDKKPESELPASVPGTILRADVFGEHWVTFGYRPPLDVLFSGNTILAPLAPNKGRSLVTFAKQDELVTSGFCWPDTQKLMAGTPYVLYQSLGKGHVIAFTDDPNYRAMSPALQRLFINAVFFGPGH